MKPKVLHQEAMKFSFEAKQALNADDHNKAFELYKKAAEIESDVAEFYFDKVDLEPTRSVLIRSAAFLNLKAGLIENAQKFIFFGLLNLEDDAIRKELNDALEIAVSLRDNSNSNAEEEFNYLNLLRQRSVHYVLEPANPIFGHSVSLKMIKDFSENYLKSLKAYAISKFKRTLQIEEEVEQSLAKEIDELVNPLVTSSAYGSFKFSIANDFLIRQGEKKEVSDLKSNVVVNYHNEIFINSLSDNEIDSIKKDFSDEEVNGIFRPLLKIKANNSPYRVGYYNVEDFNKSFVKKVVNKQKKRLLPVVQITEEDIGELETTITHKRSSQSGKVQSKTILKKQLKAYEFDYKTNQIEPLNESPIILNEDILLTASFDSESGFTITFEDLNIAHSEIEFQKTLEGFYNEFHNKLKYLVNSKELLVKEQQELDTLNKLIGNIDSFKD
ncbi:MAG: hypothetical protein CMO34_00265 [Verrucomicrobia bacterium]|nr:hypothetical protein [Verrucomicrobiota bacterium]